MNQLDDDMAWRIKEMHELQSTIQKAQGKNVDVHIRAGVSMLYAHWEGFIKGAANAYVAYLAHRSDLNSDLQPCFVALGMKSMLGALEGTGKASMAVSAVSYLLAEMDKPVKLPKTDAISAQSNLTSDVFTNIACWIGISVARYSTRFTLIDKTLLSTRNGIAHGEFLVIDKARFESLASEILELIRWFKTDIENAVVNKAFLKA
ncbi:MAG: MAE_28990/MAE_18760 family HEPN-like nuclease [Pseudomonas sp.]|nr:MAE_28990/MAE_18760 family HEPN-like nuclease [Pseudomonas sp.]